MKRLRNIIIVVALIAIIAVGGYYFWNASSASAEGQYQTSPATRGNLEATVGATGTVRSNQTAFLTWQTTGTVESVRVKAGDFVEKDMLLADLAPSSLAQNIILAQTDLLTAQRNLEDMKTSNTALAEAELAVVQAEKALDDANTRYEGTNFARASDTKVKNLQSELDLINDQITRARQYYKSVERLEDGNPRKASALSNLTSLELRRNQMVAELNYVTGSPDDNEVAQRLRNYEIAKAQLEDAQRRLERLENGIDPLEVARLEAQITSAEATINLARLISPFDGVVTLAEPLSGDQVSPGTQAFRLDDLSRLLVDVQISEIDINAMAVGQTVTMSFDAIAGKTYTGAIVEVGQVGNIVQGAVNFTVTVELTNGDVDVRPGMTAAVNILVKEIKDVLLVPNRAVRIVDGQRVVYVLVEGLPVMREIRLGSSSDTVSEVVGGDLKEGDLVILNPPAVFGPMGGPPGGGN